MLLLVLEKKHGGSAIKVKIMNGKQLLQIEIMGSPVPYVQIKK
jgi:hypothetical protein